MNGQRFSKDKLKAANKNVSINKCKFRDRGGGLVNRADHSGPCDPSLIPLGEKKKKKQKEARVGPN